MCAFLRRSSWLAPCHTSSVEDSSISASVRWAHSTCVPLQRCMRWLVFAIWCSKNTDAAASGSNVRSKMCKRSKASIDGWNPGKEVQQLGWHNSRNSSNEYMVLRCGGILHGRIGNSTRCTSPANPFGIPVRFEMISFDQILFIPSMKAQDPSIPPSQRLVHLPAPSPLHLLTPWARVIKLTMHQLFE